MDENFLPLEQCIAWRTPLKQFRTGIVEDTLLRKGRFYGKRVVSRRDLRHPILGKKQEEIPEMEAATSEDLPSEGADVNDIIHFANELYDRLPKEIPSAETLTELMALVNELRLNIDTMTDEESFQAIINLMPTATYVVNHYLRARGITMKQLHAVQMKKRANRGFFEGWQGWAIALPDTTEPEVIKRFSDWERIPVDLLRNETYVTREYFERMRELPYTD